LTAIELDDGTIVFHEDANIHSDLVTQFGVPAEKIKDGGFIRPDGTYYQHSADSARIGEQAKAKAKVKARLAKDTQAQEAKPAKKPNGRKVIPVKKVTAKAKAETGIGSTNTTFTKEKYEQKKAEEKAAEPLRGKRSPGMRKGQVRLLTVEDLKRAAWFAGYHFEAGARTIGALTKKMVEEMGEPVRAHMQKLFAEAKKTVEDFEKTAQVEKPKPAKKPVSEQPAGKTAKVTAQATAQGQVESTSKMVQQLARSLSANGMEIETHNDKLGIDESAIAAQKFVYENTDKAVEIAHGATNKTGISTSNIIAGLALQAQANGNLNEQKIFTELLAEHNLNVGWEGATNKAMMEKYTILEWYNTLKEKLINSKFKPRKTVLRRVTKSAARVAKETVDRNVKSAANAVSEGQMKVNELLSFIEKQRC
jgi:hypothetical protein